MNSDLLTPNSELRTSCGQGSRPATLSLTFDEMLSQVETFRASKVLFRGERISGIASYLAGWMAGKGLDPIVLDGVNGFDPYMVSSFARRVLISPERLLKSVRIARAFTCYQMTTLVEEKLHHLRKPWIILLGPVTTFLDEDVPEREVGPLFERVLRKMERMVVEGTSFFVFQSCAALSQNHSGKETGKNSPKGGVGRFMGSKRDGLMRRLLQFSNLVWKISMENEGPRLVLEKGLTENVGVRDRGVGISQRQIPKESVAAPLTGGGNGHRFDRDRNATEISG
jgi:hypothetical protein